MRVILLGATGNVGSRLIPALHAHHHEIILYVRTPSKLPREARSLASAIVSGSGTDSNAIKSAILSNNCDAVINAAGVSKMWSKTGTDFPAIFAAVVKAATEAGQERGKPLRAWFLSGWAMLDAPKPPHVIMDYIPLYPMHRPNHELIKSIPADSMAWSLFCASNMTMQDTVDYAPTPGHNLVAAADKPPAFSKTLQWVPLIGNYLTLMAQASSYYAPLEDCVDFIAEDLSKGLESQFVGKRVGVKVKAKA
jgi:hypothetical protein